MNTIFVDTIGQVAALILAVGAAVFTIEMVLYWFLAKWTRRFFVLETAALTLLVLAAAHAYLQWEWEVEAALLVFSGLGAFVARRWIRGQMRFPIMMMAPGAIAISMLVVFPFFFEFRLAFANLNLYTIGNWLNGGEMGWVGLRQFIAVFTTSPLQTATFWELFGRTLLWTSINLIFHVGFGLGLAMLLNRKIPLKGIYRMLLIVPWAMPQVVAVLAWRGEFHPQFGLVNQILPLFGLGAINWWSEPIPVFLSCCIVNIWLGIPFMMVVFLGGLQAIPSSYYEAASIDGANAWRQFRSITMPLLKPVVVPSITLGTIWTFNNINVIYLMTGQNGGNEYADILVTAWYKAAFAYSRYSFAAAFAVIIFMILIILTMLWMKLSRGTDFTGRSP